jgi:hypothetical protein
MSYGEKIIKVSVPQFGAPVVEAIGFDGVGCQDATKAIETALNSDGAESTVYKDEWNGTEGETEQETISW